MFQYSLSQPLRSPVPVISLENAEALARWMSGMVADVDRMSFISMTTSLRRGSSRASVPASSESASYSALLRRGMFEVP